MAVYLRTVSCGVALVELGRGDGTKVRVEVQDRDFWSSTVVSDAPGDAVEFVTGDFWEIEFSGRSSKCEWSRPLSRSRCCRFSASMPL